ATLAAHPTLPDSELESFRRYSYQQAFGIDTFYSSLYNFTFPTAFVPLTATEVHAIYKGYVPFYTWDAATDDKLRQQIQSSPILSNVAKRIDVSIRQVQEGHSDAKGAFVKLNTRSPKDVTVLDETPRYMDDLRDAVRKAVAEERKAASSHAAPSPFTNHTSDIIGRCRLSATSLSDTPLTSIPPQPIEEIALSSFIRATMHRLQIHTGTQALALLLKSRRVNQDLSPVVQFISHDTLQPPSATSDPDTSTPTRTSIVIRLWNPQTLHPTLAHEFRGFVYKNTFTCLTQYDDTIYSPFIASHATSIPRHVHAFWEEHLKEPLKGHESYVIDFLYIVDPDDPENKHDIKLIELNPFHNGAGASLFSWREDRGLLMGLDGTSRDGMEFRWLTRPRGWEELQGVVPEKWKHLIEEVLKETAGNGLWGRIMRLGRRRV
ncbi:hypothetical protein HK104_011146, partial [Borealophlyctis nickersoniae]